VNGRDRVPPDDIYKKQGRSLKKFAHLGNCRGADTTLFYPGRDGEVGGWNKDDAEKVARAKALCGDCQVQAECLAYALTYDEPFGIWGGLTSRERNKLKRRFSRLGLDVTGRRAGRW
jgi:hypothetical protein